MSMYVCAYIYAYIHVTDLTITDLDTHNKQIHFRALVISFVNQLTTDDSFTVPSSLVCFAYNYYNHVIIIMNCFFFLQATVYTGIEGA